MNQRIAILMCCKNSTKFIKKQLTSIKNQTYKNWKLYVSVDSSIDGTFELIKEITKKINIDCEISKGPNKGAAENFRFLTKKVKGYDYYSWCDHDDIWMETKIFNSIKKLNLVENNNKASLYMSGYKLIDENDKIIGYPEKKKILSFQNSLLENISPGHTFVFNNMAKDLFNSCSSEMVSHDWSMLQIVHGTSGNLINDEFFGSLYRQHNNNLIGYKRGKVDKIKKFYRSLSGEIKNYNYINYNFLKNIKNKLTDKNREILFTLSNLKKKNLFKRVNIYLHYKFKRQIFYENFGYTILLILNKI